MTTPMPSPDPAPEESLPTDGELVEAWRGGDGAALETLVRRYQRPVYRLLARAVSDPSAADDLTQKAFLRAISRLSSLRRSENFRAWLFRIALNLARNRHRGQRRWRHVPPDPNAASTAPGPDAALARAEDRARLHQEVARLPRLQRDVVRLRLDAELPFKEIAQILGTTESSAKVSHHHAVRTLRSRMRNES